VVVNAHHVLEGSNRRADRQHGAAGEIERRFPELCPNRP
jgi:hypothetical protein